MQQFRTFFALFVLALLTACQAAEPAAPTVGVSLPAQPTMAVTNMPVASAVSAATQQPVVVTVDGAVGPNEWNEAEPATASDSIVAGMRYAFNASTMFIRLDTRNSWADLGNGMVSIYIGTPQAPAAMPQTQNGSQLGFEAGYLGEIYFDSSGVAGAELKDVSGEGWSSEGTEFKVAQQGKIIELAIPFELLGKLRPGDTLQLRVAASQGERDMQLLPDQGVIKASLPEWVSPTP